MKHRLQNGRIVSLPTVDPPAIESCDGCGACCRYTGLPPFSPISTPADEDIMSAMSPAAVESIAEYQMKLAKGEVEDRMRMFGIANPATDIPCLWYDAAKKCCSHYDDRPTACRNFRVGGAPCRATRQAFGVA